MSELFAQVQELRRNWQSHAIPKTCSLSVRLHHLEGALAITDVAALRSDGAAIALNQRNIILKVFREVPSSPLFQSFVHGLDALIPLAICENLRLGGELTHVAPLSSVCADKRARLSVEAANSVAVLSVPFSRVIESVRKYVFGHSEQAIAHVIFEGMNQGLLNFIEFLVTLGRPED